MKRYLVALFCIIALSLVACKGKDKGKDPVGTKEEDLQNDGIMEEEDVISGNAYIEEEIDILSVKNGDNFDGFLCNNGILEIVDHAYSAERKETKVSLKALSEQNSWIDEGKSWVLEDSIQVDFLSYGSDGVLYGVTHQEQDGRDEEVGNLKLQTYRIHRFLTDGTVEEVKLEDLGNSNKNSIGEDLDSSGNPLEEYEYANITSFQVFEDKTILVCYSNNLNKLYDMESGAKISSYESIYDVCNRIWGKNVVVMEEEIILTNPLTNNKDKDFELHYINKRDGTLTKTIAYKNEGMGTGSVRIAAEDGEDIYIYTERGLFLASQDSDKIKCLKESNRIQMENDDYCFGFYVGVRNDFYVAYQEGPNENKPYEEPPLHLLHYY